MLANFLPIENPVLRGREYLRLLLTVVICLGLVPGCAQIRKATYPQNFIYLDSNLVKSEMALMSLYMRQIDEILADGSQISSEQQERLMRILVSMDAATNRLAAGSNETNHLTIDDNIDQFKHDVNIALRDTRADPPNYFTLGKLAGSCAACHQYR